MAEWTPPATDTLVWRPPATDTLVEPERGIAPGGRTTFFPNKLNEPFTGEILPISRDAGGSYSPALPRIITDILEGAVTMGARATGIGEEGQNPLRPLTSQQLGTAMVASPASVARGTGRLIAGAPGSPAPLARPLAAPTAPTVSDGGFLAGAIDRVLGRGETSLPGGPAVRPALPPGEWRPGLFQGRGPEVPPSAPAAVAAPAATTGLSQALAEGNAGLVDRKLTEAYRRTMQPGRAARRYEPALTAQEQQIVSMFDRVIADRNNLLLTSPSGAQMKGQLPTTTRQFAEAMDQTRTKIFNQYDQMARTAGDAGVRVDMAPVVSELRAISRSPEFSSIHPSAATNAETIAANLERLRTLSPIEAQNAIKNLNQTEAGVLGRMGPVARAFREQLDAAIEGAQGPGYQALRNEYKAAMAVENDVVKAFQRQMNKQKGLAEQFGDVVASEEAVRGLLTANPAALTRAVGIKGAQTFLRHLNNPNRAIEKMFTHRLRAQSQTPRPGIRVDPAMAARAAAAAGVPSDEPPRHSVGGP